MTDAGAPRAPLPPGSLRGIQDMVLVGAGPAGIAAACAFRRAGLRLVHLESGGIAHTIAHFPPGIRLYSSRAELTVDDVPFPGEPEGSPTREEYLAYLAEVRVARDLQVRLHATAESVVPGERAHVVHGRGRDGRPLVLATRNLVVASGGYFRPVLLGIPGEMEPHVSHYYRGAKGLKGRRVLVVGGRNSAVEAAVELAEAGAQVVMAYRGGRLPRTNLKPWLLPRFAEQRRAGRIDLRHRTVPLAIENHRVVLLTQGVRETSEPIDQILLLTGYGPDYALLSRAGVPLHRRTGRPLFHRETLQTHTEGIFLCGTVVLQWQGQKASIPNTRQHGQVILTHLR